MKARRNVVTLVVLLLALSSAQLFAAATITIVNANAPGVGFNDPTPAAPVGGNAGTTVGQQRLIAFQHAASIWGSTLDSNVEIRIQSSFEPLSCNATSAVLGSAGTLTIFSDFGSVGFFPGPEFPNTWYSSALADKLAGGELNPGANDIRARFNVNLGGPTCLAGRGWYYGLDANEGSGIDLVAVLLHEFGHGLGFQQFASLTSGALISGQPDMYNRRLLDLTTNLTWDTMSNAQRVASAINSRRVVWIGSHVTSDAPFVLTAGSPLLRVSSPAAIAGVYAVGTASFGAPLSSPGVTGTIVLGLDPADAAGPSTTDGCSAFTNAVALAGNIALVDRGTCGFTIKVKNAQDAGAIAVIVADNAAGSPPAGLGGADATIVIPSVRVTITDGATLKANLPAVGTLGVDTAVLAGADPAGRLMMNAPNPVQTGSSISHWDPIAFRNQLMEPSINSDLTHSVKPQEDLTLPLFRDIGWFPDADLDGVADDTLDACPGSNLAPTVVVGSCDSGVPNTLFATGCTISDKIADCADGAKNHGQFAACTARVLNALVADGSITLEQQDVIQGCVASSGSGR